MAAGVAAALVVGDLVGRETRRRRHLLRQVVERARRVVVGQRERAVPFQPPEGRALLDGELIEREMVVGERQRLGQLGAPGVDGLAGPCVDQVEGASRHDALRHGDRAPRLRRVVPAPEERERPVVERLHAERHPVHAGRAEVFEACCLGRGRVGLQGDLGIRREGPARRRPVDDRGRGLGRHQRGRAPAEEHAGDLRLRQQRGKMVELAQQRAPPPRLIDALPDMAVEVAVGTLGEAERPVHIEGERLRRSRRRRFGLANHDRAGRKAAASCSKARALWVSGCFSSGTISPKLRAWPSGTKIGS